MSMTVKEAEESIKLGDNLDQFRKNHYWMSKGFLECWDQFQTVIEALKKLAECEQNYCMDHRSWKCENWSTEALAHVEKIKGE